MVFVTRKKYLGKFVQTLDSGYFVAVQAVFQCFGLVRDVKIFSGLFRHNRKNDILPKTLRFRGNGVRQGPLDVK